MVGSAAFEHVERKGAPWVFGIEIDYVVGPVARNVVIQKFFYELAVRIDDGDAVACGHVSRKHVP